MNRKKILVIRHSPLKLFIHSIPAFNAIRKAHPDDEITILTERSLIKFCKRSGFFDKVWLDNKPEWFQFFAIKNLSDRLRRGKFDMVYDLQNDKKSRLYFKLLGFNKPHWNSSVLSWCSHPYTPEDTTMHYQEILQKQLKVAGIKSVPQIDISYLASDEAEQLADNFVMICAGGNRENIAHKWDGLKYAEIIDMLYEKLGLDSVLIGDRADMALNAFIASACVKTKPLELSGITSINSLISIAKKATFCLGNDTSPTHIAAFCGTKTLMFCSRFSPPEKIAPIVRNLAAIEELTLDNVDIERVWKAIEDFALVKDNNKFTGFRVAGKNNLEEADIKPTTAQ